MYLYTHLFKYIYIYIYIYTLIDLLWLYSCVCRSLQQQLDGLRSDTTVKVNSLETQLQGVHMLYFTYLYSHQYTVYAIAYSLVHTCNLYTWPIYQPLIETVQSRSELAYALKDTAQALAAVTGERDRLIIQVDKVSHLTCIYMTYIYICMLYSGSFICYKPSAAPYLDTYSNVLYFTLIFTYMCPSYPRVFTAKRRPDKRSTRKCSD